jgi:hypothetical protein
MNDIFKINKEHQEETNSYQRYTLFGQHENLDTEGNPITFKEKNTYAYIKTNKTNNKQNYYIKIGLYGKIYNPIGLYSEGKANKFLSKVGKNEYNFGKVNQRVFDMYLNFLRTKNIAWLNNAERELA